MRRNARANKILIICNMSTQMTMGWNTKIQQLLLLLRSVQIFLLLLLLLLLISSGFTAMIPCRSWHLPLLRWILSFASPCVFQSLHFSPFDTATNNKTQRYHVTIYLTSCNRSTPIRRQFDRATTITGCLHGTIVGLTGRPDPGYVRLVGQTSRTDRSDRL